MNPLPPIADVLDRLNFQAPFSLTAEMEGLFSRLEKARNLSERLDWFEAAAVWLRRPGETALPVDASVPSTSPAARLWLLSGILHRSPDHLQLVTRSLDEVLKTGSCLNLFCETGLPYGQRFSTELVRRLSASFLPNPPAEQDLAERLSRIFSGPESVRWLEDLPLELLNGFARTLISGISAPAREHLHSAMTDAILILAARCSSLGLAREFRDQPGWPGAAMSPFLRLQAAAAGPSEDLPVLVAECRNALTSLNASLDKSGVSVDLVFRIELAGDQLGRIETLALLLKNESGVDTVVEFFTALARAAADDRSVLGLFRRNLHQLSRKIVRSAGHTGEHYITSTRNEYFVMWKSAAGGGLLTTVTTAIKYILTSFSNPLFIEGLLTSLNYATSFLALQFTGMTLATKQTSVTAAALAGAISERSGEYSLRPLARMIANIVRSQIAAAASNIIFVALGAYAFNLAVLLATGVPFLSPEKALYVLKSFDPLETGTVFYAAFTGVILWASSIAGGWFENWMIFRRMPEALALSPRLRKVFGTSGAQKFAGFLDRNASGIAGNVSLGFMLGMIPVLGRFFGLPLEIRHVTLSSGAIVFAAAALPWTWTPELLWAAMGVAAIGLMNFAVSFSLALFVALRATGVVRHEFRSVLRAVGDEWRTDPRSFLLPPERQT